MRASATTLPEFTNEEAQQRCPEGGMDHAVDAISPVRCACPCLDVWRPLGDFSDSQADKDHAQDQICARRPAIRRAYGRTSDLDDSRHEAGEHEALDSDEEEQVVDTSAPGLHRGECAERAGCTAQTEDEDPQQARIRIAGVDSGLRHDDAR